MTVWAEKNKNFDPKKMLVAVWNEFVHGGHMLAFGLVGVVTTAAILLSIRVTWDFLAIIYLFTLSACLFGRYLGLKDDAITNPERSGYLGKQYQTLRYRIIISLILGLGITIYFGKYTVLICSLIMLLLSFLYDFIFKKFTRTIIGLKNFFISILSCMVVGLLPIYYSLPISPAFILVELFMFIMFMIATSFSDIKDIESDGREGLRTFAVVFGIKKLVSFLYIINILAAVPIIIGVMLGLFPKFSITLLLALLYIYAYLRQAQRSKVNFEYLISVVLDSQFILWPGFTIIGRFFVK